MIVFFFYIYGYHRDLLVLTHSFPTRRSSDLLRPPAHQVDQPLHVLHDRPLIMDGVPFREGIAPFVRIERRLPRSVLVAAANPAALGIVELAVILRLPRVFLGIGRLAQRLRHLRDREIGGGIFQRTRGILVDADIVRHVAELVVIFDALAPDRADQDRKSVV